jgi:hypothetical protein
MAAVDKVVKYFQRICDGRACYIQLGAAAEGCGIRHLPWPEGDFSLSNSCCRASVKAAFPRNLKTPRARVLLKG